MDIQTSSQGYLYAESADFHPPEYRPSEVPASAENLPHYKREMFIRWIEFLCEAFEYLPDENLFWHSFDDDELGYDYFHELYDILQNPVVGPMVSEVAVLRNLGVIESRLLAFSEVRVC